ncbi:uncharacterized protein FA14DRAFT_69474 [Meira miltonrushii]|uniref:CNH domain-containing protein n=1 Tax=Meira miltonrushii TaxID=1280837 RepID=A0A316VA42_9BASI|nr:uncharacterized protein FA14DRAFT_69474 [Meira miltonrushii]PWN34144.1 hypothetical protein FA14DRAFT_69474 [Meira miltonrushii]
MEEQERSRPDVCELRPLLYPALPIDTSINPTSPAALARSLRCAEPFEQHLYLGSTDGNVFCFAQPALDGAGPSRYQDLQHVGTRDISSKPIERIVVISALKVAAVLSESTVTFHELPSFLPIPQQVLPHVKGVAALALDDEQTNGNQVDSEGLVNMCIIRRKMIMLVKMSKDTWRIMKEIPLPGGATNAKRFGDWLCISTTSEYNIVNLQQATLSPVGLPISQTNESPSASNRPSIVSIPDHKGKGCEFLITSHSEDLTLGVFIGQNGEPTARLIEWPSHPRALALEYPYLHALLRNDTIEVHNLVSMQKEQTIHLPPLLEPRTLSNASSQLAMREASADVGMAITKIVLEGGGKRRREAAEETTWQDSVIAERRSSSRVLMIGKNVIQGIFNTRTLDSAIKAIQRGAIVRAERLAEDAWEQRAAYETRSLERLELLYVNQMLATACLRLLRFEDAAKFIERGELDQRLVMSLFPSIYDQANRGIPENQVDLFTDVADELDQIGNLDDWPRKNLIMNYCPPLDVDQNSSLKKLNDAMTGRIQRLQRSLLDLYRSDASLSDDDDLQAVLDTSHALLMVRDKQSEALSEFLGSANKCNMDVIEPYLADVGCYATLARIYEDRQELSSALELQVKLLDGELIDPTFNGTTQSVAAILSRCDDAKLVHKYGIWLVQHDAAAGVKILTKGQTQAGGTSGRSDDEILDELSRLDDKAAMAFLEAIALTRKQQDPQIHRRLFDTLVSKVRTALEAGERESLQRVTDEFVEGAYAESFVSHLSLHAETISTVKLRLKLMALLQGSTVLDVESVENVLREFPILAYEQAIVLGKKQNDTAALELLAITLRDTNSAETYCSQDRKPLSLVALQSIEFAEFKVYTTFVSRSLKRKSAFTKTDQLNLLKTLLHVYMEKGVGNEFQIAATHLLNTQAIHLSPKEILAFVPSHWPVRTLETFLSRSIRREIHRANEGHIQRSMALAQNLEVAETLWSKRRGLGGVIEDGPADSDEAEDDLGRALVEKAEAQEKLQGTEADDYYRSDLKK